MMGRNSWYFDFIENPDSDFELLYQSVDFKKLKWNSRVGLWTDDFSNLFLALKVLN